MNLYDTLVKSKQDVQAAQEIGQTEKQKRDAMLLAFVNANPGMMKQLGVRSQEYIKQLLAQQGG